jgi:flagellar biosynthesis regulator FlaF
MNVFTTLTTGGDGYWSNKRKAVDVTKLDLQYCTADKDFGELCVYFTTASWDTAVDGLIYTDKQFMTELRAYLQTIGFTEAEANDVSYSEQGMQTDEYVSCDVGAKFLAGLERLDESHVYTIWKECLDV